MTMPLPFDRSVENLQQLPAFQEAVACVRAGLSWTEASSLTRRERAAFLLTYADQENAWRQSEGRGAGGDERNDDDDDDDDDG